jgi:hypothetical protein
VWVTGDESVVDVVLGLGAAVGRGVVEVSSKVTVSGVPVEASGVLPTVDAVVTGRTISVVEGIIGVELVEGASFVIGVSKVGVGDSGALVV